jgi:hypothetical protein
MAVHEPPPPVARSYATRLLAHLIETAREQAIADGVQPVPATVSRGLLGYFPRALLEKTRFGGGASRLVLPSLSLEYGDADAIALGDVILFRNERAARTDLSIWAHQLTHVMQYQRWGLDGFASRYVNDTEAVEQEASANALRFSRWHEGLLGAEP